METVEGHQTSGTSEQGTTLTTTTPKPHTDSDTLASSMEVDEPSSLRTPTRDSFASDPARPDTQSSPIAADGAAAKTPPHQKKGTCGQADAIARTGSIRSERSVESGDVDMDEEDDGSDNESATSESGRPSKKKKSQRFYCTEFPPCNLSFTRSEHLARHIRKHTGERPFQCHCLRRFSRLDNLRQHAQTVHVNEEIPGDSLAATGTRFQRQIRTDRMRTPGSRARASTISGGGGGGVHSRGHSRNYSNSSIGSISDLGSPDDGRRRPQPLAMAQTPTRAPLRVDAFGANAAGQDSTYPYYNQSPSGYSTPTSVFSGDAGSPTTMASHLQSPIAMTPRALSWGARVPNRRLSVPSASNMFQSATPYNPGAPFMSPVASSNTSTYSQSGSIVQSPTSSVFSLDSRRDSAASEADIRRRTWHPGTYQYTSRPATSGLSYYRTPDAPQPVVATQPAAAQNVRLPGIDSFDRATERPDAPPRRVLSPMEVDSSSRRGSMSSSTAPANPMSGPSDSQYGRQQESAQSHPDGYNTDPRYTSQRPLTAPHPHSQVGVPQAHRPLNLSGEAPMSNPSEPPFTPRQKKRQGWYNGPLPGSQEQQPTFHTLRTSPEGSSSSDGLPTPSTASAVEYHPTIIHSNGEIESAHPGMPVEESHKANVVAQPSHQFRSHNPLGRSSGDMDRLDALVAVATSENRAVENQ